MASNVLLVKQVPGTNFLVDGFRFKGKEHEQYKHYFLSHFHSDHYCGITKTWNFGTIYCSEPTANLVKLKIGVDPKYIRALPMNEPIMITDVEVTLLDANHCPGSVLLLFKLKTGETYLHCGDMRYHPKMKLYPELKAVVNKLDTLYLDTTYCEPKHVFPSQQAAVDLIADIVERRIKEDRQINKRTLFLIGTYTIGKERIVSEISKRCKCKIFVEYAKYKMIECMCLPYFDIFTTDPSKSDVHIVSMNNCGWKKLFQLYGVHKNKYTHIVAFKPTGWTFTDDGANTGDINNNSPNNEVGVVEQVKGSITLYEVPYSEHSSFSELREFVAFLQPAKIVPTVSAGTYKQQISYLKDAKYAVPKGQSSEDKRLVVIPHVSKSITKHQGQGKQPIAAAAPKKKKKGTLFSSVQTKKIFEFFKKGRIFGGSQSPSPLQQSQTQQGYEVGQDEEGEDREGIDNEDDVGVDDSQSLGGAGFLLDDSQASLSSQLDDSQHYAMYAQHNRSFLEYSTDDGEVKVEEGAISSSNNDNNLKLNFDDMDDDFGDVDEAWLSAVKIKHFKNNREEAEEPQDAPAATNNTAAVAADITTKKEQVKQEDVEESAAEVVIIEEEVDITTTSPKMTPTTTTTKTSTTKAPSSPTALLVDIDAVDIAEQRRILEAIERQNKIKQQQQQKATPARTKAQQQQRSRSITPTTPSSASNNSNNKKRARATPTSSSTPSIPSTPTSASSPPSSVLPMAPTTAINSKKPKLAPPSSQKTTILSFFNPKR